MNLFKAHALSITMTLLLLITDFLVRPSEILNLGNPGIYWYLLSYFFFFLIFKTSEGIAAYCRNTKIKFGFRSLLVVLSVLIVVSSYSYHQFFSYLPNVFTFEYLLLEENDALFLAKSQISLLLISIIILLLIFFLFIVYKTKCSNKLNKYFILLNLLLILGLSAVFNNNVRLNPGAFNPFVNTVFSCSKVIENLVRKKETDMRFLSQPTRKKLPKIEQSLEFNVLFIFNESVRKKDFNKTTSPKQFAFFERESSNVVNFSNFYSNSSRTMIATPCYFTGISTFQSPSVLHNYPIISNYAKMFNEAHTFLISSQSLYWFNLNKFLDDGSWDFISYLENNSFPKQSPTNFDDGNLPRIFGKYINGMQTNNFVGVIQFWGGHYPYNYSSEFNIFGEATDHDKYKNAISFNDNNMDKIITILEKNKILDNTVIFYTSDHGEAFDEHNYKGHTHAFYDEESHVPSWLYIPEKLRNKFNLEAKFKTAQSNIRMNLSNIDIVPTFLDIVNLYDNPALSEYKKGFCGAPYTRELSNDRMIYFKNSVSMNIDFVGLGIKNGDYKYLLNKKNNGFEELLFNLKSDSLEQNNLIESADQTIVTKFHDELKKNKEASKFYKNILK